MNDTFYIRPFEPEDWNNIDLRQWERDNVNKESVFAVSTYGILFTVFGDGEIIALMGFYEKWKGVFEVLIFPSNNTPKHPAYYVRKVRSLLDTIAKSHGMRRQQAYARACDEDDKWMKVLGFKCEGTLKEFTARREDCRMWVRFNEVEVNP